MLAILGVIITIVLYWHTQRSDLNDRLLRAYKTILSEVKNHIKSFSTRPHVTRGLLKPDKSGRIIRIDFVNAYFNTDAFASLVHSGLLTYLKPETQEKLVDLYNTIHKHNEKLAYRYSFLDAFLIDQETIDGLFDDRKKVLLGRIEYHDVSLTKWDMDILTLSTLFENEISKENLIQSDRCKKRK